MSVEMTDRDATIESAISALKNNRPLRAEEICRDFLLMNPGSREHLRLLAAALSRQDRLSEAEQQLQLALTLDADDPLVLESLGSVLAMQKRFADAVPLFEKAIQLDPRLPLVRKKLGQALAALGRGSAADEQFEEFFENNPDSGEIAVGADHLKAGRHDDAITAFRNVLRRDPENVTAMRFLAVAYWQGKKNLGDAEAWLRRATSLAPDFTAAWMTLGPVLLEMNKYPEAIECFQSAVKSDPENGAVWAGLGNAYAQASYAEKSVEAFRKGLELGYATPSAFMAYAHVLKTVGDQPAALEAYRKAIEARPDFGEVYWSMANLKIFRFEDDEVAAMEEQIAKGQLSDSADVHFRFALGKAFEDKKDFKRAWHYYDSGNRKQRPLVSHDPLEIEHRHEEIIKVFTEEFLRAQEGNGDESPDPILIVGLPRSGSTLVEQILASHSQVEGTSELPILSKIVASMGRYRSDGVHFPQAALEVRPRDWKAYGKQYLDEAARHRLSSKPLFTDKLPNNFPLVGFLQLILPNAKVINTRRHPLDSLLGAYKQLFAKGQNFTYDMEELADYYRNYVRMMKHWDAVLPGKVLHVHYEETVTDLDTQVRRILEHCGLPFEESCLRFHETERSVRTASSEQVRQPIYTGALGKWREYSEHLGLWREDLADIIDELPAAVRKVAG